MGMPWKRGTPKGTGDPVRVPIGGSEADKPELSKVYAGSLFTMMEIADSQAEPPAADTTAAAQEALAQQVQ